MSAPSVSETVTHRTVVLPGQTPDGKYILSLLLKRTYDIVPNGVCSRADADRALNSGEVPWTDPMNSSVRYESDFIPFKLATDVVCNAKAYAPRGRPTTSCVVALQVGDKRKEVLVLGDRVTRFVKDGTPEFSEPAPFVNMDLRYELAYGGIDVYSDKLASYPYPRNLMGRGFVVTNSARSVDNLALPNLEEPGERLTPDQLCLGDYKKWEQQPFPAGLGWFPKTWLPRALLAGILPADRAIEQELRQAYAKLIPNADQRDAYLKNGLPDMDFRFFNGASRGLVFPYLAGGEKVVAENLSPEGVLSFQLPRDMPHLGLDIGSGVHEPQVVLHTVMIRMEDRQIDLVWRGAIPYPGPDWLPEMRKMEVLVA
ncbi:MAG TPA: DUF2169 domain-containing protein [Terriglobia bacterium]|nr:DUF2169 domain-containing protein [Terriglobia bacterium]